MINPRTGAARREAFVGRAQVADRLPVADADGDVPVCAALVVDEGASGRVGVGETAGAIRLATCLTSLPSSLPASDS